MGDTRGSVPCDSFLLNSATVRNVQNVIIDLLGSSKEVPQVYLLRHAYCIHTLVLTIYSATELIRKLKRRVSKTFVEDYPLINSRAVSAIQS